MSDILKELAESIVSKANVEEIIFAQNDKFNNLLQLIYEGRVETAAISEEINASELGDQKNKVLLKIATETVKYLQAKLTKSKMTGFRGQPTPGKSSEQKKLSKSEAYLERKRKEKDAKEAAELEKKKKGADIEKISLKEVGEDMKREIEKKKELEESIKTVQDSTQQEHLKHVNAYKCAFQLFAESIRIAGKSDNDIEKLCDIVEAIGDPEITKRQVALGKLSSMKNSTLAQDALIAAINDKNITINVLMTLNNVGGKKAIMPLLNVIKEFPTEKDILFRGPAERALGSIIGRLNDKAKNSGTKLIYQLVMKPEFESRIKLLCKVLGKDMSDKKIFDEYFTPVCIKWMTVIAEKVCEEKKKKVKVGFVNMTVHTDLSKIITEFVDTMKAK